MKLTLVWGEEGRRVREDDGRTPRADRNPRAGQSRSLLGSGSHHLRGGLAKRSDGITGSVTRQLDFSPLFEPVAVNGLTLANRFVMPGMQRMWCENGRPLPRLAQYYRRRVEGGVGLVITESCAVDHPSSTQTPISPASRRRHWMPGPIACRGPRGRWPHLRSVMA